MKFVFYSLTLLLLSCSGNQKKQQSGAPVIMDPAWQKKTITKALTISLPDSSSFRREGVLNEYYGEGKTGLYGLDYFLSRRGLHSQAPCEA